MATIAPRDILRAGPLSLTLDAGALRWIGVDGEEAIRGIELAVRDPAWGTVPTVFTEHRVTGGHDGFTVELAATNTAGDIDFAWQGRIEGDADGTIRFTVDGVARRSFLRARIGLCVLHPRSLAGRPIRVTTPWGTTHARLPRTIAPVAPVSIVRALRQPLATGGSLELTFTGDLFEMEDQRNFGDASFKTYSTPLCVPYPVWVEAGTRISQGIVLTLDRPSPSTPGTASRRRSTRTDPVEVVVGTRGHAMPSLGLAAGDPGTLLTDGAMDHLRRLGLGHVRVTVDTVDDAGTDRMLDGLRRARLVDAPVELELHTDEVGTGVTEAIGRCLEGSQPLARVLVFERASFLTTRAAAVRAREALRAQGSAAPVIGGSAAWFDLVNMGSVPIDALDALAFGMCPQAHAGDDATVMENVTTLDDLVASGLVLAGGRPLAIGPLGIAYPFDPWARGVPPAADGLPATHDRRHATSFGAAWALGALAHALRPGVAAVTLRDLAGWSGVVAAAQPGLPTLVTDDGLEPGAGDVLPVYHVLADVLGLGGGVRRLRSTAPTGVACLALAAGRRRRVLLANLTPAPRVVRLRFPGSSRPSVRILDERTLPTAVRDPVAFHADPGQPLDGPEGWMLEIGPYGLARIDADIGGR